MRGQMRDRESSNVKRVEGSSRCQDLSKLKNKNLGTATEDGAVSRARRTTGATRETQAEVEPVALRSLGPSDDGSPLGAFLVLSAGTGADHNLTKEKPG